MDRRGFLLALLAVGGCASTPPGLVTSSGAVREELEAVQVLRIDRQGLTLRVASNGCAEKAHFTFYVDRRTRPTSLAFARVVLTSCRSPQRFHEDLVYAWRELGIRPGERVVLLNPVTEARGNATGGVAILRDSGRLDTPGSYR